MQATDDGGFILTGASLENLFSVHADLFLLKLDSDGYADWYQTYNLLEEGVGYSVIQTADGGYAVTGVTAPATGNEQSVFLLKTNETGAMQWYNTYGDDSSGYSVIQTSDGGYAIAGETYLDDDYQMWVVKTSSDGTLEWDSTYDGNQGESILQTGDGGFAIAGSITNETTWNSHVFLVKTNDAGVMLWNETYGAEGDDQYCGSLIATSDGGFAIAGYTYESPTWQASVYLVKTTSDGTLQWNQTYRDTGDQLAHAVFEATSGGYVIAGSAASLSGDSDMLLLKTFANGTFDWRQTYSNTEYDTAITVAATDDGGYALAGYSLSESQDTGVIFFVITTSDGNLDFDQIFGGSNRDYGYSVVATSDGGFAIVGYTIQPLLGYSNVYLVKTLADGTLNWSKTYNFSDSSRGYYVIQTSDGGYAITGYVDTDFGYYDVLLLKTYSNGTLQWSKTFDIAGDDDFGYVVRQTPDGGFAVAGYSYVEVNSAWSTDAFLIKTDANGNLQWNQTYGGLDYEYVFSMVVTSDGGYALAGHIEDQNNNVMLIKTYPNGTMAWTQFYNATESSYCYSIAATSDGGYALAGLIFSDSTYSADAYLIKTYSNGTVAWNQTYGGANDEYGYSVLVSGDGGYVIGGYTLSSATHSYDLLLLKASSDGTLEWIQTFGGAGPERGRSIAATADGGYVIAGYGISSAIGSYDVCLVKPAITNELGLARVSTTGTTITVYRGEDDSYWQYVRIQIWKAD